MINRTVREFKNTPAKTLMKAGSFELMSDGVYMGTVIFPPKNSGGRQRLAAVSSQMDLACGINPTR